MNDGMNGQRKRSGSERTQGGFLSMSYLPSTLGQKHTHTPTTQDRFLAVYIVLCVCYALRNDIYRIILTFPFSYRGKIIRVHRVVYVRCNKVK